MNYEIGDIIYINDKDLGNNYQGSENKGGRPCIILSIEQDSTVVCPCTSQASSSEIFLDSIGTYASQGVVELSNHFVKYSNQAHHMHINDYDLEMLLNIKGY
ncbi:MAG: hypothetical protein DRP42_04915 [Tenericutes bacterium]|nr:MAG: hypothetical protein DRP42_04915 [Mycoplasmatota bacterium]